MSMTEATSVREDEWAPTPVEASRAFAKRLARAYRVIGMAGFGSPKIANPTTAWDEDGQHTMTFAMPHAFASLRYDDPRVRDDGAVEVPKVHIDLTLFGVEA